MKDTNPTYGWDFMQSAAVITSGKRGISAVPHLNTITKFKKRDDNWLMEANEEFT